MTQEEINATNWSQSVGGVCIKDSKAPTLKDLKAQKGK